jgi:ATP-dependent helicase/nuclease subunit A
MSQPDLLSEDQHSRVQALTHGSFIVEAPAGAGKTELLTQRFLTLLQSVDAPEEIIAITFTNKAASEMRLRIMQSLVKANDGVAPPEAHKQITFSLGLAVLARSTQFGWDLLNTPSRLRIYTIDSLSANLARQMPLLSRFGTQPAIQDDASLYYQEAATQTLNLIDDATIGPMVQEALRYFDNDTFKLTQLMAEMLAKRDQWLLYTQSQHTADVAEAALAHMLSNELEAVANVLPTQLQHALMPIARFAASQLPCDTPIALLIDWDTPLGSNVASLSMWRALADLLLTNSGTFRVQLNKNIGLPATDEAKPYKEALATIITTLQQTSDAETKLARLRMLPNPSQDAMLWQMVATLAKLLRVAVGQLWLVFQARGEVDFVEVASRGLAALEDHEGIVTDLALQLDYRIQHLLVDEFQDTSPTQIQLIRALTRGWQPNDGRTLFCVGDPMQSIYRFRKANVGLFLQVAKHGIGDIKLTPLKLWRNNRSCPPVIDWVNQAFAQVFPSKDSISQGAIRYRPFVATKKNEAHAGVKFHPLILAEALTNSDDGDAQDLSSDIRQQEANRIIEIIQDTWAVRPDANIAVLVRARNHLAELVSEIRRNHPSLPFQAVEIEALANRQIVQDLMSLTYALHQRADRLHWLAILRAPWCGLSLADLHALVGHDKHSTVLALMQNPSRLQSLSENGRHRLAHVCQVLTQALQHQGRSSTSQWLRGTWLALGGASCLWAHNDVQDVQAFFERVHRLEQAGKFTPEQLALEVQKLYAAPDATASQLQLMTIHKSKGLEFDTVILPGLDRKTGNHEQALMLWEEVAIEHDASDLKDVSLVVAPMVPKPNKTTQVTAYDYLNMLEKERAALEDARVLYVAATRAERCLHLLGAAKLNRETGEAQPAKNTCLSMLWPLVHHHFANQPTLPMSKQAVMHPQTDITTFVPKLIRLKHTKIPDMLAIKTTPNNLGLSEQPTSVLSDALDANIGTLTHLYLQQIAEQDLENWPITRVKFMHGAMQRWLVQRGHAEAVAERAANQVIELLCATLTSEQGRWVLDTHTEAACELAIETHQHLSISKKIIDRTFIDNNTRWIIDYKTTAITSNRNHTSLTALASQYLEQLSAYAELFKHEGRPITLAVFFVSIGQLVVI